MTAAPKKDQSLRFSGQAVFHTVFGAKTLKLIFHRQRGRVTSAELPGGPRSFKATYDDRGRESLLLFLEQDKLRFIVSGNFEKIAYVDEKDGTVYSGKLQTRDL